MVTIDDADAIQLVEWLSEIGDLTYQAQVDRYGIQQRIQSCKHLLAADPIQPSPAPLPAPDPLPSWQRIFLDGIQAPHGTAQASILTAWAACEGGLGHNNPFNVSAPIWDAGGDMPWFWNGQNGSWNNLGNGFGVATFDTVENGSRACAKNLQSGFAGYGELIQAIRDGDAATFANSIGLRTWGTGNSCPKSRLGV